MHFFDCSVQIGRDCVPVPGVPRDYTSVGALLNEMEHFGIDEALLFHRIALDNPRVGNRLLMEEIAAHESLHPCWVVSPHTVCEEDEPENVLRAMTAQGVRAVKLHPEADGYYRYPLKEWMCG